MPSVTFCQADGQSHRVDAVIGLSIMEIAVRNGIAGIQAQCGGCCTCATCHVIVADEWRPVVGGPSGEEAEVLSFAQGAGAGSRLACQIRMSDGLDGLVVNVPAQG